MTLDIDIVHQHDGWKALPDIEDMLTRALSVASEMVAVPLGMPSASHPTVCVLLTDDAHIRTLNRDWRGIDKPTNVLSFPGMSPAPHSSAAEPDSPSEIPPSPSETPSPQPQEAPEPSTPSETPPAPLPETPPDSPQEIPVETPGDVPQEIPQQLIFEPLDLPSPDVSLGDIVLSFETLKREAEQDHLSLTDHAIHLTVHGFLHLIGYDHETDDDAEKMEAQEIAILHRLGIDDPYHIEDRSLRLTDEANMSNHPMTTGSRRYAATDMDGRSPPAAGPVGAGGLFHHA